VKWAVTHKSTVVGASLQKPHSELAENLLSQVDPPACAVVESCWKNLGERTVRRRRLIELARAARYYLETYLALKCSGNYTTDLAEAVDVSIYRGCVGAAKCHVRSEVGHHGAHVRRGEAESECENGGHASHFTKVWSISLT
jgi:hypothetical protein